MVNAVGRYFWIRQGFFFLPLFIMLGVVFIYTNNAPEQFFRPLRLEISFFTLTVHFFTKYLNLLIYFIYAVLLFRALKDKNKRMLLFIACFATMHLFTCLIAVQIMKATFGVPRPFMGVNECRPFTTDPRFHSFPSGHVAEMYGAVGTLCLLTRKCRTAFAWGLLPALTGFTRIYLGQHSYIDVLGGALMATCTMYGVFYLFSRFVKKTA